MNTTKRVDDDTHKRLMATDSATRKSSGDFLKKWSGSSPGAQKSFKEFGVGTRGWHTRGSKKPSGRKM